MHLTIHLFPFNKSPWIGHNSNPIWHFLFNILRSGFLCSIIMIIESIILIDTVLTGTNSTLPVHAVTLYSYKCDCMMYILVQPITKV